MTAICYKALPVYLMIAAAMFHLPHGYMTMDLQAFYMFYRPVSIPSRPQSSHGYTQMSQFGHGGAPTLCCKALPLDIMIAAAMFHLHCGCMAMDWQAFCMI